jgi:hypothetical protein
VEVASSIAVHSSDGRVTLGKGKGNGSVKGASSSVDKRHADLAAAGVGCEVSLVRLLWLKALGGIVDDDWISSRADVYISWGELNGAAA